LQDGQARARLNHPAPVHATAFRPDGRHLATVAGDGMVRIWDAATGQELRQWKASPGKLSYSPNGKFLACNFGSGQPVVVWDEATAQEVRRSTAQGSELCFTPDNSLLLTFSHGDSYNGTGRIFELATPDTRNLLIEHKGFCKQMVPSPDSRYLATVGTDKTTRLYDLGTGREWRVFRGHTFGTLSVAFSPDGTRLASGDKDGMVKVWDVTREQRGLQTDVIGSGEWLGNLAFRAGSAELISVNHGGSLTACDASSGHQTSGRPVDIDNHWRCPRNDAAFDPAGKTLVAVGRDQRVVKVWDTASGKETLRFTSHTLPVTSVAISSDGQRIATAGHRSRREKGIVIEEASEAKIWDGRTGKELIAFRPGSVACMALTSSGQRLATGGWDGKVRIWDATTGQELAVLPGKLEYVSCVAFRPGGEQLAATDLIGNKVHVWNVASGQELGTPPGGLQGPRSVTSVTYSPDGTRIAAVGYDSVVVLWDATTGHEVLNLPALAPDRPADYALNARVVFSPDGTRLAANAWNGTVTVWDAEEARAEPALEGDLRLRPEKVRGANLRAFRWHVQHADIPFHWQALVTLKPPSPALSRDRGALYVRRGLWKDAAADYSQAIATGTPDDVHTWSVCASLALLNGDADGYRRTCQRMLEHLGASQEPAVLCYLARTCGLDAKPADPAQLVQYSEKALASQPDRADYLFALALSLYRAGQYEPLLPHLRALRKSPSWVGCGECLQALTHDRLGQAEDAIQALRRADSWLQQQTRGKPDDLRLPAEVLPLDWLAFHILRAEAESTRQRLAPEAGK
jgi:WD40 repeat protein